MPENNTPATPAVAAAPVLSGPTAPIASVTVPAPAAAPTAVDQAVAATAEFRPVVTAPLPPAPLPAGFVTTNDAGQPLPNTTGGTMTTGMWVVREAVLRAAGTVHYQDRLAFHPDIVTDIKNALHSKLWRGTLEDGIAKLQALTNALCTRLNIGPATVRGGSMIDCYTADHFIMLQKVSLVSFLHEFGHHILNQLNLAQNEDFPRAFSLGLFKTSAPKLFEKARVNGKLMFVDVEFGALATADQVAMIPTPAPAQVTDAAGQPAAEDVDDQPSPESAARMTNVVAQLLGTPAVPAINAALGEDEPYSQYDPCDDCEDYQCDGTKADCPDRHV